MITTKLPGRISRLDELANNLWWSWHEEARRLFRTLDYPLWHMSGHNPVKQLREVDSATLQAAAEDPAFLAIYDTVLSAFDAYMSTSNTWFDINHPTLMSGPVAYFSMEFAIHNSLPIYAGGLGVLAGDQCKEVSDLGLPLVAIGFIYPQGYFRQRITSDGWQEEIYSKLDFQEAPISRVLSASGEAAIATVDLGNVAIAIGVWQVRVGRTNIYLMDTNLEENPTAYRQLSARLYVADREQRLQQEIVLGIGGVRVLRALNINPSVWHANEGHTAFMMLERIREQVASGLSFAEAVGRVQTKTIFTTHTPVIAGHDSFSAEMMEKYFGSYWQYIGLDRETFLQLGQQDSSGIQNFNMTVFALKMADQRCAVSQLHGRVTRRMWHGLWPEAPEDQVPISHITNGIHVPSWIAPELTTLLQKYLGNNWIRQHDAPKLWERMLDMSNEEFWMVHQLLKRKLIGALREGGRNRLAKNNVSPGQVLSMGALLDPEALTIGFTRRFAEYKRHALIFRDIERLKRIINNQWRPVQVVFAGKSHPADFSSKRLLQQVYTLTADRELQGRIAFIEDYDMHMARYLVQGVDVWLNTPRRLQEACGTSGMKAAINGVLNLSILDGWWKEAYNGKNGWAIGDDQVVSTPEAEDDADAESVYRLLEDEIAPLFYSRVYSRDSGGIPHDWIHMTKESIRSILHIFCSRRMMKEYVEQMYRPAAQALPIIESH
jgi:starch phosphorylase